MSDLQTALREYLAQADTRLLLGVREGSIPLEDAKRIAALLTELAKRANPDGAKPQ